MKYILSEILNQAIMTKTPIIIVEGIEDVKIYDAIAESIGKKCQVLPIECIDGYHEGNEHVINSMNHILEIPPSRYNYSEYILGIIDKDVRDFRRSIPINPLIFPLSVYSIESHFVNKESILLFIKNLTRATSDLIIEELQEIVIAEVLNKFKDLYLFSLDALKGAIDSEHQSYFSYSFSEGRVIDNTDIISIRQREETLLSFAQDMRIEYNLDTLKKISKGKWLLFLFCYHLEKEIRLLPLKCRTHQVPSCRVCVTDIEKCLYKIKDGVTHKTLKSIILNSVETNELDYIREKISTLHS